MNRARILGVLSLFVLGFPLTGSASSWFVGYDIGQMAFNDFKHVAGEIGYSFENEHSLRLAVFNVALSERHLSSGGASAVDGDNVEGLWHGVDLYYDYPITKSIFISPSIGYHDHTYTHTVLGTSLDYVSLSAGFALSYCEDDFLGFEKLYSRFSISYGHRFKEEDDRMLGDSVVLGNSGSPGLAFSIGYRFE